MAGKSLRHFFANVVCGFVYNKDARKRLRVILNSPVLEYIKFIKQDTGISHPRIKTFVGHRARSLIIGVDDKWVYKFPLRRSDYRELTAREVRLVSALSPISPFYVPPVTVINWRGMLVRKYPFVHGVGARHVPRDVMLRHAGKIGRQIAEFLHAIASVDPDDIRDLKPDPDMRPGYACGWCQGDIYDNFILDPKTMDIVSFIDWEDCRFTNFEFMFSSDDTSPAQEVMAAAGRHYAQIANGLK